MLSRRWPPADSSAWSWRRRRGETQPLRTHYTPRWASPSPTSCTRSRSPAEPARPGAEARPGGGAEAASAPSSPGSRPSPCDIIGQPHEPSLRQNRCAYHPPGTEPAGRRRARAGLEEHHQPRAAPGGARRAGVRRCAALSADDTLAFAGGLRPLGFAVDDVRGRLARPGAAGRIPVTTADVYSAEGGTAAQLSSRSPAPRRGLLMAGRAGSDAPPAACPSPQGAASRERPNRPSADRMLGRRRSLLDRRAPATAR